MSKAKKVKIDSAALGSRASFPVYVNEHLTRTDKQLLEAAIQRKWEMRWKFLWTTGGEIFARRTESSPVLRIAEIGDLSKMAREVE